MSGGSSGDESGGHWLQPLLAPRKIAVVCGNRGVDQPPTQLGLELLRGLQESNFRGRLVGVGGKATHARDDVRFVSTLDELEITPDLAVLAVGPTGVEAALEEAACAGAGAVAVFGTPLDEDPSSPTSFRARLRAIAKAANMPVCGPNTSGFVNSDVGLSVHGYLSKRDLSHHVGGHVTHVSHSGSSFLTYLFNDPRIKMNLGVSCGNEVNVTAADYLDYALDQESTRVLSMVIEQARDPEAFEAVLYKAATRNVPVVALKLGVSEAGQQFARSHSGALAGDDDAYAAVFDRYGVMRVSDLDEMAATLVALSGRQRMAKSGGLGAVLDSGGERGLLVDVADAVGLPLANISNSTQAKIAKVLGPGLEATNPLDCGDGAEEGQEETFKAALEAVVADRDTAVGMLVADVADGVEKHERLVEVTRQVAQQSRKPVMLMVNYSKDNAATVRSMAKDRVPVLDGTRPALVAVKRMLEYRDFCARIQAAEMGIDDYMLPMDSRPDRRRRWREQLRRLAREEVDAATGQPAPLCESVSMSLFRDYNVPVVESRVVNSPGELAAAAEQLAFPLAVKTGKEGVSNKSEVDGVRLNLNNMQAVQEAYDDLALRLGLRCIVATMGTGRLELMLEVVNDPVFGAMVRVGAGGALMDLVDERTLVKAPCSLDDARRALRSLPRVMRVMKEWRGHPAVDEEAVVGAIQSVSVLAADVADIIAEMDVNPLLVSEHGAVAVDGHIIPSPAAATARVTTMRAGDDWEGYM